MVKTIADALKVDTPSIFQAKKTYGIKHIEAYIKVWLIDLNQSVNATRPLTEYQIDETAYMIVAEHYNLTIADINVIFKNAKTGKYGDLYGTISMDKILKWFEDYFNERGNIAGEMSRREHDKRKYREEKIYENMRGNDNEYEAFKKQHQIDEMKKKYQKNSNNG